MKLKALFIVLTFTVMTSAFAQVFPARVNVSVLPGQVTAEVFNPFYEPIVCSGQVFGQTVAGPVFNSFFLEQVLPAGDFRLAFVRADFRNPFVTGWANISCRFLRFF